MDIVERPAGAACPVCPSTTAEWRGVVGVPGSVVDRWHCTLNHHEFGTERPAYDSDQPNDVA